jgi:hypothetical protein
MARSSPLAKLSPPKEVKSTALAFANADSPKHEPKPAQTISAQTRPEQTRQQQKPPAVFADVPQPIFVDAPKPQPVFADAFLTSANAGNLFVQRTLTISDMKEYVKRTYPNSQTADLIRWGLASPTRSGSTTDVIASEAKQSASFPELSQGQ